MAAVAHYILQSVIIAAEGGSKSKVARAIGGDWKGKVAPLMYAAGIAATFFVPWVAGCLYAAVAVIRVIPSCHIEEAIHER